MDFKNEKSAVSTVQPTPGNDGKIATEENGYTEPNRMSNRWPGLIHALTCLNRCCREFSSSDLGDHLRRRSAIYSSHCHLRRPLPGRHPTRLAGIRDCSEHNTPVDERNSNLILHTESGCRASMLHSLQPINRYNYCLVERSSGSIFEQFCYGLGRFPSRKADKARRPQRRF